MIFSTLVILFISNKINCINDDKPEILDLNGLSKSIEGKKSFLNCLANSNKHKLIFEWFLNNEPLKSSENIIISNFDENSMVHIKSMSLNTSGLYKCKVKNLFGEDSKNIKLDLKAKPRWVHELKNITVKLNSDFEYKCHAIGFPKPIIKWIKLGSKNETLKTIDNDTLKMRFLKEKSGIYKCVAENIYGKIEGVIDINYFASLASELPVIQDIFIPKNLNENQTVRLICALLQGAQPLKFEWFYNDKKILDNKYVKIKENDDSTDLTIKSLVLELLGEYKCVISNSFGKDFKKVEIIASIKPKWVIEPQNLTLTENSNADLKCEAIGFPLPKISWSKLSPNNNYVLKTFDSKNLNFLFKKEDAGSYECKAENSVGAITKTIYLEFFGKY